MSSLHTQLLKVVADSAGLSRHDAPGYSSDLYRSNVVQLVHLHLRRSDPTYGKPKVKKSEVPLGTGVASITNSLGKVASIGVNVDGVPCLRR